MKFATRLWPLLFCGLLSSAAFAAQTPEPKASAEVPSSTENKTAGEKTSKKIEAEIPVLATPGSISKRFIPSEKISEDLSVAFPVDI